MQNVMPNATNAFFSGFMPTNASAAAVGNLLTYTIRVMDKTPIWFYCSQAKHCQSGMVGAINAYVLFILPSLVCDFALTVQQCYKRKQDRRSIPTTRRQRR